MTYKVIKRCDFIEHNKQNNLKNTEIEAILNKLFNSNKNWRNTYKSVIFKANISDIEKKQNEIKSLLNKFSNSNFVEFTKKILIYCEANSELSIFTLEYIFNIAMKQPIFCNLYVKLIKDFVDTNPNLEKHIVDICMNYKDLVNSNNIKNNKNLSYDDFCKNNILKQYKVGYSQLFGELFINKLIKIDIINENIVYMFDILKSRLEKIETDDYIEDLIICINRLVITIIDSMTKAHIHNTIIYIDEISSSPIIIKRLKFKLMDLKDILGTKYNECRKLLE